MRQLVMSCAIVISLTPIGITPTRLEGQERLRRVSTEPFGTDRYTSVAAVRELRGGRILVAEPEGSTLWIASSSGERVAAKATAGAGSVPGGLRALGADTTVMFDRRATQFVLVLPDGSGETAPSSLVPPEGPMRLGTGRDLYVADARGRLYWTGRSPKDTDPLWRRGADGRAIEIAALQKPPVTRSSSGGISITTSIPFAPQDAWAVADDGTVVIARATPYRVDRVDTMGVLHPGVPVVLPVSRVTEGDRRRHEERARRELGSINLGGASLGASLPSPTYPDTMAPFTAAAVRVAPDGTAWVHRAESVESDQSRVDVFDTSGGYRETLTMPRGAIVVGFGARVAYVSVPVPGTDRVALHTVPWR